MEEVEKLLAFIYYPKPKRMKKSIDNILILVEFINIYV